jgi:thymidylate synthase
MAGLVIRVDDLINGYRDVVNTVLSHGEEAMPRGLLTYEVLGATIVVDDPTMCLPLNVGRGVSRAVAAMETLQLIGGFSDPSLLAKVSPAFEKIKDGGIHHGAYGPRAGSQFPRVVSRLKQDPYSRRAMVNIWNPQLDLYRDDLHDYPCTVSLEYTVRNGHLIAQTHMRSNDVWLGLAYDAFVFTQVQLTLCDILGYPPGPYIHHASSLHIYETDVTKAKMMNVTTNYPDLPDGVPGKTWHEARELAHDAVYDGAYLSWYSNALEGYLDDAVVG